jgi:hypothetical protein
MVHLVVDGFDIGDLGQTDDAISVDNWLERSNNRLSTPDG